jgi:hypothetical protein
MFGIVRIVFKICKLGTTAFVRIMFSSFCKKVMAKKFIYNLKASNSFTNSSILTTKM